MTSGTVLMLSSSSGSCGRVVPSRANFNRSIAPVASAQANQRLRAAPASHVARRPEQRRVLDWIKRTLALSQTAHARPKSSRPCRCATTVLCDPCAISCALLARSGHRRDSSASQTPARTGEYRPRREVHAWLTECTARDLELERQRDAAVRSESGTLQDYQWGAPWVARVGHGETTRGTRKQTNRIGREGYVTFA